MRVNSAHEGCTLHDKTLAQRRAWRDMCFSRVEADAKTVGGAVELRRNGGAASVYRADENRCEAAVSAKTSWELLQSE
jgi:hypothetical protein